MIRVEAAADTPRLGIWHVVVCKPRQENVALDNLRRQGFDAYLPRLQTRQCKSGKWIQVVQPLFPRYLFVRIDAGRQNTAVIRSTRGAVGLLRFGIEPARVPEAVIEAIVAREDPAIGCIVDTPAEFHSGERVTLLHGPFAGVEGIFSSSDGDERAVLLIELLGKTNQIRVHRDGFARAA